MTESPCLGFEPQTYLKERCKKCFRLRSNHDESTTAIKKNSNTNNQPSSNATKERSREKRRSWKDKLSGQDNSGPEHTNEEVDDETTTTSLSYKSAVSSKKISSAKSIDSISSIYDSKSLVTAISESITDNERAATPTENDPLFSDTSIMKREIELLKEEISQLKEERQNWTYRRTKNENEEDQTFIEILEERLAEAENCIQDYRDENTVLKCELRELQESGILTAKDSGNDQLIEKLSTMEILCNELKDENESLKNDVKDLQQEIEEMQDQYREEEIEEFRELQRELEQNAKNCRILQFKLRKAERMKEQIETEKQHLNAKVKDLLIASSMGNSSITASENSQNSDAIRVKELESELRIAKEVSIRLHNELENAEDKRYKLEDEVFYLKEKVRELQTQNKWREARNKSEQQRRINSDISLPLSENEMSKEMRDILEREADLRDQLKFTEDDLKRTQLRLQDVETENEELLRKLAKLRSSKRPPMMRSISEGHAQIQLELAEQEVEQLSTKVERLEQKNIHLSKKLVEIEMNVSKPISTEQTEPGRTSSKIAHYDIPPEMRNDMSKMIAKIDELQRKNMELNLQLQNQDDHTKIPASIEILNTELRIEKEHKKMIESELNDLKKIIVQSDNQKLISMAIKVEILNNQLSLANERCNNLHRKIINDGSDNVIYMNALKQKCEEIEKQLSEQKANALFKKFQGETATTEEIEQCCEVLASVEAQTHRICKQIEKIDNAQKDERRRSLSKDGSAAIIAELASVMSELDNVHRLLEAHKINIASSMRLSPVKKVSALREGEICDQCKDNQSLQDEIAFYKKKNKDLTNQILQTEDRWNIEIEKQRQIFEVENKNLNSKLTDTEKAIEEYKLLLESRTVALAEKGRMLQERDERCEKLKLELLELKKEIQDIDLERKSAKEYEIKYKKLESMYDVDKEKFSQERTKMKTEMSLMKKKLDDTLTEIEKLKKTYGKKETTWLQEKEKFENELASLREHRSKEDNSDKDDEGETICTIVFDSQNGAKSSRTEESNENHENAEIMKKQLLYYEKKNAELLAQIRRLELEKEESKDELVKMKQNWTRDKDNLLHKARQDEKIRNVEFDALQQKFTSRMKIMEDTNKSLHSQLVQARRERDYHREALSTYRRQISEEEQRIEKNLENQSNLARKCSDMTKQITNLENELKQVRNDLKLAKETHESDKALWLVERTHFKASTETNDYDNDDKIMEKALKAAENVQKKYSEYQKFYSQEVNRLHAKIKELTNDNLSKQSETERISKELHEQIKVLEISQRNLIQARDLQISAKETIENELSRIQENVRLNELHRLTRKYRIASLIDQLNVILENLRKRGRYDQECYDKIKDCLSQLKMIREEDNQLSQYSSYTHENKPQTSSSNGEKQELVGIDSDGVSVGPSDNLSQSSLSVRSYNTLPTSYKWSSLHSAMINHSRSTSIENYQMNESQPLENSSQQAIKKVGIYPDPPPSLIINKEKNIEYDKDGRLRYIPRNNTSRSTSCEVEEGTNATIDTNTGADIDNNISRQAHSRSNSAGTNILYKIRREELARGGQPSVKLMAKAFDSMHDSEPTKSFFSLRKSRSVETNETSRNIESVTSVLPSSSSASVTVLGRNTSLSQIEELMGSQSPYGNTMPRINRNPFKNMGTKLVERVRRSLSRSSRKRNTGEISDVEDAPDETKRKSSISKPKKIANVIVESKKQGHESTTSSTPVKKVRTVKKKVKKVTTSNIAEQNTTRIASTEVKA